jgi:hypothetical protein
MPDTFKVSLTAVSPAMSLKLVFTAFGLSLPTRQPALEASGKPRSPGPAAIAVRRADAEGEDETQNLNKTSGLSFLGAASDEESNTLSFRVRFLAPLGMTCAGKVAINLTRS